MKMRIILLLLCVQCGLMAAETCVIKNDINPWLDREFTIGNIPECYLKGQTVPKQSFNKRRLIVPKGTQNALIGIAEISSKQYIDKLDLKRTGFKAHLMTAHGGVVLKYDILIFSNPPENLFFADAQAGVMLLALNVDEQQKEVEEQIASFKGLKLEQEFIGQEWSFKPGTRKVKMYVREPSNGVNKNTGFMLLLHNWGGTYKQTVGWCNVLADRYNVVAISVDYLQSGEGKVTPGIPYDHGYLQAVDCLRAIYQVRKQLLDAGATFSERRYYAAGGSGGGNVTLMCNKLAPYTFASIVDMCGMPGLTDDIAFGKGLNAGYSKDPASPAFVSVDMQEIRDPGNLDHLKIQYGANPKNKVIIVHGLDDSSCSAADKIQIFLNMVAVGFHPDGHFLTQWNVLNQKSIQKTNHTIGSRLAVIQEFGDDYLLPSPEGALAVQTSRKNDFERSGKVIYPTKNGRYVVDYSQGTPSIKFEKSPSTK